MQSNYLKPIYLVIAFIALIMCWSQNIAYLHLGPIEGLRQFVQENLATPATRSILFDISWFYLAALFFMVTEAKRLKMPYVWAYIIFGFFIAISVTFPVFLYARENHLKK